MKKALLIVLLLAGCASGTQDDPNAPKISLHLEQYQSGQSAYAFNGPVSVQFALSVANTTNEAVKLNRIEIRTIGSGAYTIPPTSTPLNIDLGPGQARTVPITLWGYSRGGHLSSTEPVTVRATAYFSGPAGAFVRLFSEYFTQQ